MEATGILQTSSLTVKLDNDRIQMGMFSGSISFDGNSILLDGNVETVSFKLHDVNVDVK